MHLFTVPFFWVPLTLDLPLHTANTDLDSRLLCSLPEDQLFLLRLRLFLFFPWFLVCLCVIMNTIPALFVISFVFSFRATVK